MGFQVGSALLDACLLSVLRRGDAYGYFLTQTLRNVLGVSESTLYPVLKRLQKDGFLTVYDQPYQGRNRRYYTITRKGVEQVDIYRHDWELYRGNVDKLVCGGGNDE